MSSSRNAPKVDKSQVPMYLKEAVQKARCEARRIFIVEVSGKRPYIATTEKLKDTPAILGDAITCAINHTFKSANGEFTKEQIMDAMMVQMVARIRENLSLNNECEAAEEDAQTLSS